MNLNSGEYRQFNLDTKDLSAETLPNRCESHNKIAHPFANIFFLCKSQDYIFVEYESGYGSNLIFHRYHHAQGQWSDIVWNNCMGYQINSICADSSEKFLICFIQLHGLPNKLIILYDLEKNSMNINVCDLTTPFSVRNSCTSRSYTQEHKLLCGYLRSNVEFKIKQAFSSDICFLCASFIGLEYIVILGHYGHEFALIEFDKLFHI